MRRDSDRSQDHVATVVKKLLECIEDIEGRKLYADKFYASIPLAKHLFGQKITYCGTVRANRKGIPKKKLKKGEVYGEQ